MTSGAVARERRVSRRACITCNDHALDRVRRRGVLEILILPFLLMVPYQCWHCGEEQYLSSFRFPGYGVTRGSFRRAIFIIFLSVAVGLLALGILDAVSLKIPR